MRYLLPCPCGGNATVETRQAGEAVKCPACSQTLTVPTMRGIRALEAAPEEQDAGPEKPPWTRLQGVMFASGVVLTLIAATVAIFSWNSARKLDTALPDTHDRTRDAERQMIDSSNPSETWGLWLQFKEHRPTIWTPPDFVINRRAYDLRMLYAKVAIAFTVIGLALAISAFIIRPRPVSYHTVAAQK